MSYRRNKRKRMRAREKKWPVLFRDGTPILPLIGDGGQQVASWNFMSRPLPKRSA